MGDGGQNLLAQQQSEPFRIGISPWLRSLSRRICAAERLLADREAESDADLVKGNRPGPFRPVTGMKPDLRKRGDAMKRFEGKVEIVTGGAGGIGSATARERKRVGNGKSVSVRVDQG